MGRKILKAVLYILLYIVFGFLMLAYCVYIDAPVLGLIIFFTVPVIFLITVSRSESIKKNDTILHDGYSKQIPSITPENTTSVNDIKGNNDYYCFEGFMQSNSFHNSEVALSPEDNQENKVERSSLEEIDQLSSDDNQENKATRSPWDEIDLYMNKLYKESLSGNDKSYFPYRIWDIVYQLLAECGYVFVSYYSSGNDEKLYHLDPHCKGFNAVDKDIITKRGYHLCPKCKDYRAKKRILSQEAATELRKELDKYDKKEIWGINEALYKLFKKNGYVFITFDGRVYHNSYNCSGGILIPVIIDYALDCGYNRCCIRCASKKPREYRHARKNGGLLPTVKRGAHEALVFFNDDNSITIDGIVYKKVDAKTEDNIEVNEQSTVIVPESKSKQNRSVEMPLSREDNDFSGYVAPEERSCSKCQLSLNDRCPGLKNAKKCADFIPRLSMTHNPELYQKQRRTKFVPTEPRASEEPVYYEPPVDKW